MSTYRLVAFVLFMSMIGFSICEAVFYVVAKVPVNWPLLQGSNADDRRHPRRPAEHDPLLAL